MNGKIIRACVKRPGVDEVRKLQQIIKLNPEQSGYMEIPPKSAEVLALDENGELWHGTLETTADERRVIDWSPVNTPKDGAAYSEPQLSFFDKWEKEAHERLQADAEASGETVSLETEKPDDTREISEEAESPPDDSVENGEGTDPD